MILLRRTLLCLTGVAALCPWLLCAQNAPGAPPVEKSPVAIFRELLAMTPAQRAAAIAQRPPEIQKRILDKLEEYKILPAELRELRLRETELRWYLRPLMDEPRTNRAARLAQIPENERKIVEERLQTWDLLPPDLQEQWKNDDMVANYFAQNVSTTPEEQRDMLKIMPSGLREKLQAGFDRWNHMSQDQRQKAVAGFNKMFEVKPEEQEKALDTVSEQQERKQMEKTLEAYGKLTPTQRQQCIQSFEKLASMSVVERQQFLKNAARWSAMTPQEREKWRQLVIVAPIMPQMDNTSQPTNPPPHSLRLTAPTMATN